MSYILEGLKKLEQKRRQEVGAPGLLTFKEEKTSQPVRPIIWPYLLFIALLLNAGVIVWWIGPWRSMERSKSPQPTVPGLKAKAVTITPVEMKKEIPAASKKEPPLPEITSAPPRSPAAEKTIESKAPATKKNPAAKSTPGTGPVSPVSPLTEKIKILPEGPIVKLNDLPSEIKQSLPDLKMSVHFYSPDKQASFVTINGRILHEGEVLSEGIKVLEINPAGTVLKYRNNRFLISVN
jgi:general secretion pathway protein B